MSQDEKKENTEVFEWVKSIALAIAIALLIKTFVFNTTYVIGNSMYPTLLEKDRLFALKIPLYFGGPEVGDIVVLEAPDNPSKDYIKRVIATSGDKVEIIDGEVYVNDELLDEDYTVGDSYTYAYEDSIWIVPEGYLFVLGDNRAEGASKDSRYFGPVTKKSVKGVTGFRYFPIDDRFGNLD